MKVKINPSKKSWTSLAQRPVERDELLLSQVEEIFSQIEVSKNSALAELTKKFDGIKREVLYSKEEIIEAADKVSGRLRQSICRAMENIEKLHQSQLRTHKVVETSSGVICWKRTLPIEKVGLYVPGGTAPLFSTLLMLAIPAKIAGCREIIVASPPQTDGGIHPTIAWVLLELGIHTAIAAGGAQAIAALACGTESIPTVDKIFGPGNKYVMAAKQFASLGGTAIDLPAGPSEVLVLADESAESAWVASDLLSQAEHGPDSQVILLTTSKDFANKVIGEIKKQLVKLSRRETTEKSLAKSHFIVFKDVNTCVEFANFYAPEHMILQIQDASEIAEEISHAGSVFVGKWAPEALGDYILGPNHTLPTARSARAWSGVSIESFQKTISFQSVSEKGLLHLAPHAIRLAEAEGLSAHANSVSLRLDSANTNLENEHRKAKVKKSTKETSIQVSLTLDGNGFAEIETGLGFFDHMLEQITRHSGISMQIKSRGDLNVDEHHTIEDTGLALGQALKEALGDKLGLSRYGFCLPMDESLARVAIDLGGRPWLIWNVEFKREKLGDVPTEMFEHFFKSLSDAALCNINVLAEGKNDHHKAEAIFKAFARALRMATKVEIGDHFLPSTKGVL